MLIIISPAKIQNFKAQRIISDYTLPVYLSKAVYLRKILLPLPTVELEKLLQVNPAIARRASDSYYNWNSEHTPENSKQAVLTYNGEVYRGLHAKDFTKDDFIFAQKHLRIISGLYGVLRPLDLIQSYRLEMNTKLKNSKGDNLYSYWKDTIPQAIMQATEESGEPLILLNLASNEYAKAVNTKKQNLRVIDFEFLENRHEDYKPITVYIKKARGLMARYIIQNRINQLNDLKGFDSEGYLFNERLSSENKLIFTR